ncbi:ArsR/SmtB family transcription factor [Priestia endophytica]|jgi:ArsR family transcriptional regulator|uniref:Transcriptional regulator n=1 Tax=Priestia endophytica TaxID=135735 RepID=A0AAX1Q759_9BACI|nr:metalloregulator ArsR/SmtB family transcription factor [Priestia endophytica]RAS74769.1 transcriptional regulator [Priestia endophytica]RAS87966.1 transcriptional regulator [Priestia endophytica]
MVNQELSIEGAAAVLKILGDKTRLSIMKVLEGGERCVCELVELYDISQPAISQHLKKMRDIGLVKEKRRGQWMFYSLNSESADYEWISTILKHLPHEEKRLDKLQNKGLNICCE